MSGLRDGVGRPAGVELTVVVAAFDAEDTLGAQLDALAAQRVPFAWELVVADNGSTDGTAALARSYADRLPVRVVDASATRGAGAARNVGVSVARAPLVAFCDADDVVGDGWLAAMRTALRAHPFVAGRFDGERLNSPRVLRSRTVPQTTGLQESTRLPGLRAAGAGNMGIRADLFRAVGGFDPGCLFLEDTDLCWRLQLAGVPLTWVPEAVLHVRLRGSMWSSARQGFHYGTGERWLALRYREQEGRLRELAEAGAAAGAGPSAVAEARTGRVAGSFAGVALAGAAAGMALVDPALAAGVVPGSEVAAGAALTTAGLAAEGDGPHRPGALRAARRLAATGGDLLRVRSLGDLGRWTWDVGWGIGFAFGRVDPPTPVRVPPAVPSAAPSAATPPAAVPPAAALPAAVPPAAALPVAVPSAAAPSAAALPAAVPSAAASPAAALPPAVLAVEVDAAPGASVAHRPGAA